ncbi:betaine-aldehyde dehydrogenase [Leptospira sp. GIMC2001]|uniref:betaine-aldehyde dehydrogenase n=1 Tax=Leptospira sp. GIMC2001 TaxID=1513297 RepID=UPI00234A9C7B|nr:betaine-aldehyde dehydrogenase [Leptospira sp. GIMC2001]WCL49104.1 betaine-aldehyde dehydrogenase [Leptospira sp. GIMC2001]
MNNRPKVAYSYINGKKVQGRSTNEFDVYFPGNGEKLFSTFESSVNQIDEAVDVATIAQKSWKNFSTRDRGRILIQAAFLIRKYKQELAEMEVWDTGKPLSEALEVDIITAADALEYYGNLAITLHGDYYSLPDADIFTKVEPIGICAGIGAWNYPFQIASWKSAPALACGNAFLFKPSELTPLSAVRLAEIYEEAGLPKGLFQVLQGGANVGQALTKHQGIQKISFTGEAGTGRKIMSDSSGNLKTLTMELGGKSPLILFSDVDPNVAAKAALSANFYTQGEVCTNGTRVFVEESFLASFKKSILEFSNSIRIGNPFDLKTNVGALISKQHLSKVRDYVKSGIDQGANPIEFGELPSDPWTNGYFMKPVIFYDCQDSMKIVQEEIFGPVMSVLSFKSENEVIERANSTEFGLGAGIFTKDINRIQKFCDEIESGMIWINNYNLTPMEMPFGGTKQSGFGKENGLDALQFYTKRKSIYYSKSEVFSPF